MSESHSSLTRTAILLAIPMVPTVALTVYLLSIGEHGATIATVLAIPLGVTAILAPVVYKRLEQSRENSGTQILSRRAITLTAAGTILASIVLPGAILLTSARYADLPVRFDSSPQLDEDRTVTIQPKINETPWPSGNLVFTPKIAPTRNLGDCLLLAKLTITPIIDGQHLPQQTTQHNKEVSITIPGNPHDVRLNVSLRVPGNQGCIMSLSFAHGNLIR